MSMGLSTFVRSLYDTAFRAVLSVIERDVVPDVIIRAGIRQLLGVRYRDLSYSGEETQRRLQSFVEELKKLPVAIQTAAANEQHYELPTAYFLMVLGPHLKYSSCFYPRESDSLERAEEAMLLLTCQRAELLDGQDVLELGCGWGSLSLYMAQRFPNSKFTSVSNSRTQKDFLDKCAAERGITNLRVITEDMVVFNTEEQYDRVVSIEMFEHMKNYQVLLRRISCWLKPSGKLFVHIFVNRRLPYHFEVNGEDDWMTKYFFAGGTMPSENLLLYFQADLCIDHQWYVNGRHYSKTLEDWLKKHDKHRAQIMPLFEETYGKSEALRWFVYWRLFYLACSELFAYNAGEEWGVAHYLFVKK